MSAGGLTLLHTMKSKLPKSEKMIADYIIAHPDKVIKSTIHEMSQAAGASSSAVIRLCKSLGLNGYHDLKMRIAGDLMDTNKQGYRDIEQDEPLHSIIQKAAGNSIQSIKDTAALLNEDSLEKAVQLLLSAKQIHFIGVGASGIVAADAQQKFLRINYAATAFTDMHIASTVIANAGKDDIVFGISFSGETIDIIQTLQLAKDQQVKTIALTHPGQTSVSALCDVHLSTAGSNEAPFRSAATSSRLAQLYLIDVLFLSVASRQYVQTAHYIDKTRHAIHSMKRKTKGDST
ncbi:MurR/RpiR family transcriptional regulator [Bacillus sp. 179-C3.3 HS]|uniref:MurR/RpiR family transcriptional regulator n=1 Tax=Bacillus sp. 179-C3.3 HS TaxID=3232162 RepID=UPI0039A3E3AE